jgi:RNA polymerase sigma-70 factor (ECF subfamily)
VAFTVQAPEAAAELLDRAPGRPTFEGDDVDVDLIRAAQAGDLRAFASLYDRHRERLVRFCRSRLGDADDAADAAQETFLRAWRALDTFGNRGNVYPWLHAIARNVCTDILRKRLRVEPSDDQALGAMPDTGITAHELLDAEADTVLLRTAFDRLSDRHREILAMREYEGWTYERIADEEQLELNAVKSLLWRARQALRREFLLLTDEGRLAGLAGLGVILRGSFPTVRHAFDRAAVTVGDLASATSAAVGNAGVAAASAVSVAAVVVGMTTTTPPPSLPPAPPAVVATVAAPSASTPLLAGSASATTDAPARATTSTPAPATDGAAPQAGSGSHGDAPETTPAITVPEELASTLPTVAGDPAPADETTLAPASDGLPGTETLPNGTDPEAATAAADTKAHGKADKTEKTDKTGTTDPTDSATRDADRGYGKKR